MRINQKFYIILKIIIICILMYLFFEPSIFASKGYNLAIDGVVVCRGLCLVSAIHIFAGLLNKIVEIDEEK